MLSYVNDPFRVLESACFTVSISLGVEWYEAAGDYLESMGTFS